MIAKIASGPFVFLCFYLLPYQAPSPEGRAGLAVFAWMVTWWVSQPIPWAISSLLPLLLFPALGVMSTSSTVGLYGQNIFFWVMGTVLMAYALERHGLAKRFALWFLASRLVSGNTNRLVFGFMLVTGLISAFFSNAATVGIMIPVGVSVVTFVKFFAGIAPSQKSTLGAMMALGALYGAVAGGTATLMGSPFNALSVDLLQTFTGDSFGFFRWMSVGVPIFLASLLLFYLVLRTFLRPEISEIPGGQGFIQAEREQLGPLTAGERATVLVFLTMVLLFALPTLIDLTLGPQHPVSIWADTALSIWVVPPTVVMLLFLVPVNWRKAEFVLTRDEMMHHTPWQIAILGAAAVGVTSALAEFGFPKLAEDFISELGLGTRSLPFATALLVSLATNFFSGTAATALFGAILIPASEQIGFNPSSMTMLVPNVATGIILPWGGATAATAFATGELEMKTMIRIGVVATLLFCLLVAAMHTLMAAFL